MSPLHIVIVESDSSLSIMAHAKIGSFKALFGKQNSIVEAAKIQTNFGRSFPPKLILSYQLILVSLMFPRRFDVGECS